MLPLPPFSLHSPTTLDDALALLTQHGPDVALIAGGTDLLPNMKQGLTAPKHVVSLAGVGTLRGIKRDGDVIRIGAMNTLEAVANHPLVKEHARALSEAARAVGGPHHRRMGTLGGNLCLDTRCRFYNQTYFWREALGHCLKKDGTQCHVVEGGQKCVAAASNDTGAACMALDCVLELVGPKGPRQVPARDFYTGDGIKNTLLEPGEIVTALRVPAVTGRSSAYEKLRRRGAIDFPILSVAVRVDQANGTCTALEIVVSALAARPRRVGKAEALALGKPVSDLPLDALADASRRECNPLPNVDDDTQWRRDMVPVLVKKALQRAASINRG